MSFCVHNKSLNAETLNASSTCLFTLWLVSNCGFLTHQDNYSHRWTPRVAISFGTCFPPTPISGFTLLAAPLTTTLYSAHIRGIYITTTTFTFRATSFTCDDGKRKKHLNSPESLRFPLHFSPYLSPSFLLSPLFLSLDPLGVLKTYGCRRRVLPACADGGAVSQHAAAGVPFPAHRWRAYWLLPALEDQRQRGRCLGYPWNWCLQMGALGFAWYFLLLVLSGNFSWGCCAIVKVLVFCFTDFLCCRWISSSLFLWCFVWTELKYSFCCSVIVISILSCWLEEAIRCWC